jgi:hypothetical protein
MWDRIKDSINVPYPDVYIDFNKLLSDLKPYRCKDDYGSVELKANEKLMCKDDYGSVELKANEKLMVCMGEQTDVQLHS